jgi:hypothetical protein
MIEKKHGGYRQGAGRKKKDRSNQQHFQDAESYLLAVVQGEVEPDSIRVQAAKTLISYQQPKQRVKPKSQTPSQMRIKEERSIESANLLQFEEKAEKIREKYNKKEGVK